MHRAALSGSPRPRPPDGSDFLSLSLHAGIRPGASYVCGIGLVCGTQVVVTASVPTIKGGAFNEATLGKMSRISEIAYENRLPVVSLVQSAGADLSQQFKVFHKGGGLFRDLALRSASGVPTISVVFGSSTAGGAYQPGMSDYTIMVKDQAKVYLGGPPLVQMATGEIATHEELGGADMHSRTSGVSDFLASNEHDAVRLARHVVAGFDLRAAVPIPRSVIDGTPPEPPRYPAEDLLSVASADIRVPYDVREVIARLVDGSRFHEFKPLYGAGLVCAFAAINGYQVGVLANNGVLFSQEAQKATQFIQLVNQRGVPLLYLSNITGFMVGKQYEQGGIVKHGSLFINAVTNSTVPAITVVIGASYGAGNYAMCGRAYRPRFLFSWPQSQCSVMGAEQLAGVMDIIAREAAKSSGRKINEEQAAQRKMLFKTAVEEENDVYYTSARCIDDGIIDPRDTRAVLTMCLSACYQGAWSGAFYSGISRL